MVVIEKVYLEVILRQIIIILIMWICLVIITTV